MGNSTSRVAGCFAAPFSNGKDNVVDLDFLDTLDEGLGHSFCYVRPVVFDSPGITPSNSERFLVDSTSNFDLETNGGSFRREEDAGTVSKSGFLPETTFKTISGASVSANPTTARTTGNSSFLYTGDVQEPAASFESTASFAAIPLQPVPRSVSGDLNGGFMSGPLERGFASGPLEKGGLGGGGFFMSGPLERGGNFLSGPLDCNNHRSNFSGGIGRRRGVAGLGRRLMRSVSGPMRNAFSQTFAKHISDRAWMQRFFHPTNTSTAMTANQNFAGPSETEYTESRNLQWAHGKAGEDRVHVVLSEEQGWLFIGIYDGFSGPDAPDFLMCNLYRAIDKELEGLLWDYEEEEEEDVEPSEINPTQAHEVEALGRGEHTRSMRLSELLQMELMEEYAADSSLSVSDITSRRFDSMSFQTEHISHSSDGKRLKRSAVGAKLRNIVKKQKSLRKKLFPWNYDWDRDRNRRHQMNDVDRGFPTTAEEESGAMPNRRMKSGPVDHGSILDAMTRGLQSTEDAYVAMVESTLDTNPELALMGSCVLVMLMKDEDVYVMNLGDSRVVLAQENNPGNNLPTCPRVGKELDRISEESPIRKSTKSLKSQELSVFRLRFGALQLSSDHSTSIDEEVSRIKSEHPEDSQSVFNDRVKGQLKVTRAFGAAFLKKPNFNDALLEMFRIDYIGTSPYLSCIPSLLHHRVSSHDRFLVLSSDGLYQYFGNDEVVVHVAWFMENVPEGDPAQYLIAELLCRAAKKNGMDFYQLLDIPQGDRRKYHDDVSVMVVSLQGRIWRSCG